VSEVKLSGRYEPPMANGEVLFDAPWQGRVFGMAVTLAEQGRMAWSDFQGMLIEVVGAWDADHPHSEEEYPYYELFAESLSRILVQKGLLDSEEIHKADGLMAARPHGHDH